MVAANELKRLLEKAGVSAHRRIGRVRALYDPAAPKETIHAALAAVRTFAPALVDEWGEPTGQWVSDQRCVHKLSIVEVCDDPCPRDVDPNTCAVAWLVARSERYHFRFVVAADGTLAMDGLSNDNGDKWDVVVLKKYLPAWYVAACRARTAEILDHLATLAPAPVPEVAVAEEPESEPPPESEPCAVCGKELDAEDREVIATNHLLCDRGGSKGYRDIDGFSHEPTPRCPYKPR